MIFGRMKALAALLVVSTVAGCGGHENAQKDSTTAAPEAIPTPTMPRDNSQVNGPFNPSPRVVRHSNKSGDSTTPNGTVDRQQENPVDENAPIEELTKRATDGVKLVPVACTLGDINFTVPAPPQATVVATENEVNIRAGDRFAMKICIGNVNFKLAKKFWADDPLDKPKRYVYEADDAVVRKGAARAGDSQDRYYFTANRTIGHLDYHVESSGEYPAKYSLLDCALMLYCARNAKLDEATYEPFDSVNRIVEYGTSVHWDSDGKVVAILGGTAPFTDTTMKILPKIAPNLEWFIFPDVCYLTDAGLEPLEKLTRLQKLEIGLGDPEILSELSIDPVPRIDGSGLIHLKALTGLKDLLLNGQGVDDAALAHLSGLKSLTGLSLIGNPVTNAGLGSLHALANLERLDLDDTKIDARGLSQLAAFKSLKNVTLGRLPIGDADLKPLNSLSNLESLAVDGTAVTGRGIGDLTGCPRLAGLVLDHSKLDDEGLKTFGVHTELDTIWASDTRITGAGFAALSGLKRLKNLNLSNTDFNDEGLSHLAGFTQLVDLMLSHTKITNAGLVHLKGLQNLRRLVLDHTAISDEGIEHLAALKGLERIWLSGSKVSAAGRQKLGAGQPREFFAD